MPRFIEWDSIGVRVSGEKLNELVRGMRVPPIERLELRFFNGLLRIEGTVRKFVSLPFVLEIVEMTAAGTTVRVPVRGASVFGGIPIPLLLFRLAKGHLPGEFLSFEEPATFVVSLDHFLPSFITADVQKIWIIEGGLAVTLGGGGADLPQPTGGS